MSFHAHSRLSLHRRSPAAFPRFRWHAARRQDATVLVGSAVLVLAVTLLLLSLARPAFDRGSTGQDRVADTPARWLPLHGAIPACEEQGVLHAPPDCAPPGIWTPTTGPGPVR